MRRFVKIAIFLVLLGVGLGAAILFRRSDSHTAAVVPPPSQTLTLRASDPKPTGSNTPASAWPDLPITSRHVAPKPLERSRIPTALRAGRLTADSAPPELARRYQGSLKTLAMAPPRPVVSAPAMPAPKLSPLGVTPTAPLQSDMPSSKSVAKQPTKKIVVQRMHKIIDGDTLSLLARR